MSNKITKAITLEDVYWEVIEGFNKHKFADSYSKKLEIILDMVFVDELIAMRTKLQEERTNNGTKKQN